MVGNRVVVHEFDDLAKATLSESGRDRVLRELADVHRHVLWLNGSFRSECEFEPLHGTRNLFGVDEIIDETEKAWLIRQGSDPYEICEWIPKSCGELYSRDPNHGISLRTVPQKGLGDFCDFGDAPMSGGDRHV